MDARNASDTTAREIVIERVFDVPATTLWLAITDPEQMRQWYMPQVESFDAAVGSETRFTVHHNGKDFVHIWKVTEVIANARLSYSWEYAGYPGSSLVTFELTPAGNGTRLKLSHTGLDTFKADLHPELAFKNFLAGWTAIMASLQAHTENNAKSISIERVFDAPRALVWQAWTDPEHIKHWWGPKGFHNESCHADVRVGGSFNLAMRAPDGNVYPCVGTISEVRKPERIVYEGEAAEGHPCGAGIPPRATVTVSFAERDGKTHLTLHTRFASAERKLAASEARFVVSWEEALNRLADELAP